jgi:hypothetical protein
MDNAAVGQEGKSEGQPVHVARQGIGALTDDNDHVYAASVKTKLLGVDAQPSSRHGKRRNSRKVGQCLASSINV